MCLPEGRPKAGATVSACALVCGERVGARIKVIVDDFLYDLSV